MLWLLCTRGARLREEGHSVLADLPRCLESCLVGYFKDLDRFAHDRKDEREDNLSTACAGHIDIHHNRSVVLEKLAIFVEETQRVEDHECNLNAGRQDDQGPVQAHHRAVHSRLPPHQLDAIINAADGHGKDAKTDHATEGVQPDRNLELPENVLQVRMLRLVVGSCVEDARPDGHHDVANAAKYHGTVRRLSADVSEALLSRHYSWHLAGHLEVLHGDDELSDEQSRPRDGDFDSYDASVVAVLGTEERVGDAEAFNDADDGTDDEHDEDCDHKVALLRVPPGEACSEAH